MQSRRDGFSVLTEKKRVKVNASHRERKGVPEHRSNVLKGSLSQGDFGLCKCIHRVPVCSIIDRAGL